MNLAQSNEPYVTDDLTRAALAEAAGGRLVNVAEQPRGRLVFTFTGVPADFDRELQLDRIEVRGLAVLLASQRFVHLARDAQKRRAQALGERSRS